MRKIFYSLAIVFGILLTSSFTVHEANAQIESCTKLPPDDVLNQDFEDFSNELMYDWKIIEFSISLCYGSAYVIYELPQFSTQNAVYQFETYVSPFCYSKQFTQNCDSLKTKNDYVLDKFSELHSTEIFKEINEKLNIKKVLLNAYGDFEIIAENIYEISSKFNVDTSRDYLLRGNFTNDVNLESSLVYTETKNHLEKYLDHFDSTCQIKSCNDVSCGKTLVGKHPFVPAYSFGGYGGIFQTEGEMCPTFLVTLSKDLKFYSISNFVHDQKMILLPFIAPDEKSIYELNLDYGIINIPYNIKNGVLNQTTINDDSIELILDVSDNGIFTIDIKKFTNFIDEGFGDIEDIYVLSNGSERKFKHTKTSTSLLLSILVNSDTKNVQITANDVVRDIPDNSELWLDQRLLDFDKLHPPKQQIKNNVPLNDIICQEDLNLIIKKSDGSPACVKSNTTEKLMERGWTSP